MKAFLLRHADAENTLPDEARILSPKGRQQVRELASFVKKKLLADVTEIRHSPYARACETAELFKEQRKLEAPLVEASGLLPSDDPLETAHELAAFDQDILLVGHNFHIEELASCLLTGKTTEPAVRFKKCGLLCVERAHDPTTNHPFGLWVLRWYIVPKLL
ncbi:MAG: histidine phosphatase family protein [Opitutales bacterium]